MRKTAWLAAIALAGVAHANVPFRASLEIEDMIFELPAESCRASGIAFTAQGLFIDYIDCRERLFRDGFEGYGWPSDV